MQCNYNSFIQIINFHGLFHNALRCPPPQKKNGACRILVPLQYQSLTGAFSLYNLTNLLQSRLQSVNPLTTIAMLMYTKSIRFKTISNDKVKVGLRDPHLLPGQHQSTLNYKRSTKNIYKLSTNNQIAG